MTPAWRVAAALALACNLDWGRWVAGRDGWCGRRTCPPDLDGQCRCASPPVADPSDAAAYLADCARRGVEPGPLPSLEYRPDAGLWWAVECSPHDASIVVHVGYDYPKLCIVVHVGYDYPKLCIVVHVGYDYPKLWTLWGPGASTQGDHANLQACFRRAHHQMVECSLRLVTAAAAALETDGG
ncbi:MAG: hypothetical protein IPN32_38610 [Deltaproteobacteria bacterium]|nr:hypothetical protein [Deltaproteobacteria bacterium]